MTVFNASSHRMFLCELASKTVTTAQPNQYDRWPQAWHCKARSATPSLRQNDNGVYALRSDGSAVPEAGSSEAAN